MLLNEKKYNLVGQDGNAFALMGYTARAMRECGLKDEVDTMRKEATSGDYWNLIRVCNDYVQRCNELCGDNEDDYEDEYEDDYDESLKEGRLPDGAYRDWEVEVGWNGFIGVGQVYEVSAPTREQAKEEAITEAYWDLCDEEVEDLGDGDYKVTISFCGAIGVSEEYEVSCDSKEEAIDEAIELASQDLDVIDVRPVPLDEGRDRFKDSKNRKTKKITDKVKRYSDVVPKSERGWWYFTTHGVQPGSIPDDLNVLETKDGKNKNGTLGTFVKLNGILNTDELRKYDMVELPPIEESLTEEAEQWAVIEDDSGEIIDVFDTKDEAESEAEYIRNLIDVGMCILREPIVVEPYYGESLTEDTIKRNGKWVNKGKEGTHGTFKTKKAADAQRKAMFANGYREELTEDKHFDYYDERVRNAGYTNAEIAKVLSIADDYINKAQKHFITYDQMDEVADKMGLANMSDKELARAWYLYHDVISRESFAGDGDNYADYSDAASAFAEVINREARKRKATGNYNPDVDESLKESWSGDFYKGIANYMKEADGPWAELVDYRDGPSMSMLQFMIDGDWKHDHARFDYLVKQWAEENGRKIINISEDVIEDTGSDWYPAYHNIYIAKDVNESLNEASYGGAFDIEDDMYFTREEINDFVYSLCDKLEDNFDKEYKPTGVYMETPNDLYIAIMDEDGYESYNTFHIDMRKIKKPSDLNRYFGTAFDWFNKDFNSEYEWEERIKIESLDEGFTEFDPQQWSDQDIETYNHINWEQRNYEDYDAGEPIEADVVLYGDDDPRFKTVTMHKYIRSNPTYPPYYAPVEEKPFGMHSAYVGPMFDGEEYGIYQIHDRYETEELHEALGNGSRVAPHTKTLKEYLNELDRESMDDGTEFYDLVNLFENADLDEKEVDKVIELAKRGEDKETISKYINGAMSDKNKKVGEV